ncbi:subtilisin-like protease SBT4.10 [Apium graveolens]|uniref:subtilisin-like protease SBT4.10 n=1 Tax=Apium graveolens TaxID=4045 RepID=UPI003D7A4233
MMQQSDADAVHESVNPEAVCEAKIAVIDFGRIGKLTDTDLRCFKSPLIDRVFHSSRCEPNSDTMLDPQGFSCASIITGASRQVNFFDMNKDEIKGVYPSAQLYTYATGCGRWLPFSFDYSLEKRCVPSTELTIKAIDQAIKDEVKVISMSIGDLVKNFHNMKHRQEDIVGMWTLYAYGQGVLTCTAMGNDGPVEESAIYGWPWGLTAGACTSKEVLVADVEIAIKEYVPSIQVLETIDYENEKFIITHRLQGVSFNMFETQFLTLRVDNDEDWSQERILRRDKSACSLLPPHPKLRNQILTPNVHTACAIAVWSEHPKWKPSAVKSALITTGNEFAYGAGLIDLERAKNPGLVYQESYDRFVDYVKGECEIYDLNLATFAASFSYSHKKCIRKFARKLKDVTLGEGEEQHYTCKVTYFNRSLDPSVRITVEPPALTFKPGEEKEFVLSVEIQPHEDKGLYVSAMLKWDPDEDGQSVCSPIHLYHHSMLDEPVWYDKPEIQVSTPVDFNFC